MKALALATTTYSGRPLSKWLEDMANSIERSTSPQRLEDTLTLLKCTDPFAREVILRAFRVTLREGGSNEHLTRQNKWLKGREKWATVPTGKPTLTFQKTTVPTSELGDKIEQLNGHLSDDAKQAGKNLITTISNRAGQRLDQTSVAYLVEDVGTILSNAAALERENALHRSYQEQMKEKDQMLYDLVAKLTDGGGGGGGGGANDRRVSRRA